MGTETRCTVRLDAETNRALRLLAQAEDRSMAAQIRHMVRKEAAARGLWTPRPVAAKASA